MIPTGLPCATEATPAGRPEKLERTVNDFCRVLGGHVAGSGPAQANNMVFYGASAAPSCREAALAAAKQSASLSRSQPLAALAALGLGAENLRSFFLPTEAWWHLASRSLHGWCGPRRLLWPEILVVRRGCLVITALFLPTAIQVPHGSHQPGAFSSCGRQSLGQ